MSVQGLFYRLKERNFQKGDTATVNFEFQSIDCFFKKNITHYFQIQEVIMLLAGVVDLFFTSQTSGCVVVITIFIINPHF
ncbi:MAG: hypothetical protein COB67_02720 [SAR324 cluster bacterium]|uniref:Uncharacterized protein n=1 Tax=SAR324 cluster bacterium TaxID=2024889 RepID=A0A2A4T8X2_9DELT|nr:MAG: hypothetical protein COB67_02720 [SAR324 cluster bacterium]